ncbi:MAG: class I SAM-dependent methyltransferase [Phycisphaerae bacterium]
MTRTRSARATRLPRGVLMLLTAALLLTGPAAAAPRQDSMDLRLWSENLLELQERFAKLSDDLPEAQKMGMKHITAYEENAQFVYVAGFVRSWMRRVVFLKPGVFVVDDLGELPGGPVRWKVNTRAAPKIQGTEVTYTGPDAKLRSMNILPAKAKVSSAPEAYGDYEQAHVVSVDPVAVGRGRYVHVFYTAGEKETQIRVDMASTKGPLQLTVTQGETTFELALPPQADAAGTIATSSGGKEQLAKRLLPSGVMPHGTTGVKLLERWDKPYRGTRMPGWDAGRVANQLKKAVEEGKVKPGKALVLGCGTGTNAVFLAQKGFEVTGLEVAPTALKIAAAKARKAGVKIRWIVADAGNPTHMEPFDFIFDRGCYHHVRWVNLDGYVAAVRRLTRPGGQFLLLSFRATGDRQGKPRVKESQIRQDFSAAFEFEWLKEMRFDSRSGTEKSAPAWTVLMKRKAPAKPALAPNNPGSGLGGP